MKKLLLTLAAGALGVTATAASAGIQTDLRQANQQRQIDAGGRSGKLSRAERNQLTAQQKRIKRMEAAYARSGGVFTKAEERRINRMLDQSQRDINRLKNNRVRGRGYINI